MSFLSAEFALFVALTCVIFHAAPAGWRACLLLVFSYLFYASWSLPHTLVILAATAGVHVAALTVSRCRVERRKFALTSATIAALVALLAAFKWGGWLAGMLVAAGSRSSGTIAALLMIPLGISYYLFKTIGYLLDVYWEKVEAQRSFVSTALYVSFFPQIVSGPIQRAGDFFGQLQQLQHSDAGAVTTGLRRILFGLIKKIVIADRLAVIVTSVHADPAAFSPLELLLGAYCFALQLYFDFSGMTDIALGIGSLFGIKGPENFNSPFSARNIQDFWRRWHMSLTSWLTDYLFIPLRMAFRGWGNAGLSAAILINMLAVGIWHGPKWTYAVFGALNGAFMVVSVFTLKKRNTFFKDRQKWDRWRAFLGPLITFHLLVFTMIFFRAESLHLAFSYLSNLIPHGGTTGVAAWPLRWSLLGRSPGALATVLALAAVIEFINWSSSQPQWRKRFFSLPCAVRWGLYYAGTILVILFSADTLDSIYAQF